MGWYQVNFEASELVHFNGYWKNVKAYVLVEAPNVNRAKDMAATRLRELGMRDIRIFLAITAHPL